MVGAEHALTLRSPGQRSGSPGYQLCCQHRYADRYNCFGFWLYGLSSERCLKTLWPLQPEAKCFCLNRCDTFVFDDINKVYLRCTAVYSFVVFNCSLDVTSDNVKLCFLETVSKQRLKNHCLEDKRE